MALTEDAAAKIILIRSIEEGERNFFSDSLLVDAFAAARNRAPGLGWVKARADFLFDHLSFAYQSVIHLATLPTPLTLPVCLIALVLGFATNLLGPAEKIHVVRNPVLLLVAWAGLRPVEIAAALDVDVKTVRTRLHRARTRLRGQLTTEEKAHG